jgi:hypothetical protein
MSSTRAAVKRFPVFRALIAFFVIPVFTVLVYFLPGAALWRTAPGPAFGTEDLREWTIVAIIFAWPGYIAFLVLGLPTAYLLFRSHRTGFGMFAFFGAVYTSLPWLILGITCPMNWARYLAQLKETMPVFAAIGVVGGLLTRLIIFGFRYA